ncbi:pyridoxal phosphate-dependent aminotransferase [Flavilitoribacter nigricans]|uniref:Aminotransferase n=1 Tax=Flavilitoribacter nigricans (strain ATCC 23147 / DSM 23189 / NBRC 102662 / NCIMB 1420 / SS-2) TaxID=1122177 RepID=A0A2D0NA55_FLAN2|nr:pyridoxal phosphate-dependent aminotransferase [Flavilitoribacter nigricans]PHN05250.1 aspartate aminotransferase [Flavilitoribacter nigricans DSM 23189 = NBRC 102662]
MPSVSKRGEQTPLSPFRKLIPIADRVKAAGKKVYHLNIGQPDIESPAAAMAAVRATDTKILAYSPAEGNASYRQKLVGYYKKFDIDLEPEHIMVTTGGSEAIQFMFLSCLDKGDEVIIPEPFYANYNGFAHIGDIKIKPITSTIDTGFALPDPEAFEAIIGPRTKAIFITNPNNPTGCFYPKEALKQLASIVKKHDLFLFVDEVYREFCYDDQEFFSALNLLDIQENVVVIDSISKRYSACGARIGAIVTYNQQVRDAASRFAKLRLSPPGLAQIFAEATLDVEENYLSNVKEEYDNRRQTVYRRLQAMPGVTSYKPGGAFYCFAQFPIDDADAFCQWLLEEFELDGATVMLSPGQGFYATPGLGHNEVRIAYVLNTTDLEAAMDCLEEALISYPGRVDNAVEALTVN